MIPREWAARGIAGLSTLFFLMVTFLHPIDHSPNKTAQVVLFVAMVFAVLVGTGDITIGRDWK